MLPMGNEKMEESNRHFGLAAESHRSDILLIVVGHDMISRQPENHCEELKEESTKPSR